MNKVLAKIATVLAGAMTGAALATGLWLVAAVGAGLLVLCGWIEIMERNP